jgi:ABC-2 type transport system permease protein
MAANAAKLQPVKSGSLLLGFSNLFKKEIGQWLRRKTLLINIGLWPAITAGMLTMTLYAMPGMAPEVRFSNGLALFVTMSAICASIASVISMQGAIIDEKNSGTAAWVLSKPISRFAFVISKFAANSIALVTFTLLVPAALSCAILQFSGFGTLQAGPVSLGVVVLVLHTLFYIALTLMLSTFFNSRGPAIGIPLAFLFAQQIIMGLVPITKEILPAALIMDSGDPTQGGMAVAAALVQAQPIASYYPVIATALMAVVFIGIAIWRFGKEEF